MTAPKLSLRQEGRTALLAREIGAAFRTARLARGDRLKDVGVYIGTSTRSIGNVSMFERGVTPNLMLGTAVRYLAIYGLQLAVVPIPDVPRGTSENTHKRKRNRVVRSVDCAPLIVGVFP